jgi:hypothetical protein
MLGLGEYGSSDEEDKIALALAVIAAPKGRKKQKMKRVMNLSAVLPPEIRQLLESGGGGGDDEDDEDNWSASKSAAAKREARRTAELAPDEIKQHGLFALLPKPVAAPIPSATFRPRVKEPVQESVPSKKEAVEEPQPKGSDKDSDSDKDEEDEEEETNASPPSATSFFSTAAPGAAPAAVVPEYYLGPSLLTITPAPVAWQEVQEAATGDLYFWNAATGETSWERPAGCPVTVVAPEVAPLETSSSLYAAAPAADAAAGFAFQGNTQFEPQVCPPPLQLCVL